MWHVKTMATCLDSTSLQRCKTLSTTLLTSLCWAVMQVCPTNYNKSLALPNLCSKNRYSVSSLYIKCFNQQSFSLCEIFFCFKKKSFSVSTQVYMKIEEKARMATGRWNWLISQLLISYLKSQGSAANSCRCSRVYEMCNCCSVLLGGSCIIYWKTGGEGLRVLLFSVKYMWIAFLTSTVYVWW